MSATALYRAWSVVPFACGQLKPRVTWFTTGRAEAVAPYPEALADYRPHHPDAALRRDLLNELLTADEVAVLRSVLARDFGAPLEVQEIPLPLSPEPIPVIACACGRCVFQVAIPEACGVAVQVWGQLDPPACAPLPTNDEAMTRDRAEALSLAAPDQAGTRGAFGCGAFLGPRYFSFRYANGAEVTYRASDLSPTGIAQTDPSEPLRWNPAPAPPEGWSSAITT